VKRTLIVAVTVEAPPDFADEDVMDALRWKHDVPGADGPCEYQSDFESVETLALHLQASK
jgi:hypothetical protein